MRLLLKTAAAMIAIAGFASTASALTSGPGLNTAAPQQTLIEKVHGCHREVAHGRRGWHYHRGYNCNRYSAAPRRRHYEHRRPRCYTDCNYVGPVKVCKERCR